MTNSFPSSPSLSKLSLSKLSDAGRLACKVLADRLIAAAGGPENAWPVTRVKRAALSKYRSTNPEFADHFMPLDVAVELTLDTMDRVGPLVARHFAGLTGHAVVRLPEVRAGEAQATFSLMAREVGETIGKAGEALSDGRFDRLEAADIVVEIDQAVEALLALKAVAQAAE